MDRLDEEDPTQPSETGNWMSFRAHSFLPLRALLCLLVLLAGSL